MSELTPAPRGYPIKLVRDQTPGIVNGSGEPGDLFYGRIPDGFERAKWLRRKLMEEVSEYLLDPGPEELADVVAVIEALAVWHGLDLAGLERLAAADDRGGFFDGVMMYGRHPEFDGQADEQAA